MQVNISAQSLAQGERYNTLALADLGFTLNIILVLCITGVYLVMHYRGTPCHLLHYIKSLHGSLLT